MKTQLFKLLLTSFAFVALSACSSQPNQIIVNPVYQGGQLSNIDLSLSTSVIDLRGDPATLKLIQSDQTKTLASQGLTASIKSALDSALSRNGATISNLASTRFELDIHTLQAVVTEKMMTHTSQANVEFGLRVVRSTSNFSKIYRGSANLEGPLSHDRAKVEGQLNKLTEQLLTRMMADPELLAFLEG